MSSGTVVADGNPTGIVAVTYDVRALASRSVSLGASLVVLGSSPAFAQGVRVTGSTSMRFFELQPLAQDSVLASQTIGSGTIRDSPAGPVTCPETTNVCYYYRSQSRAHTLPFTQDLEATGWGLGRGVSAYVHVRARASAGGVTDLYPRESDHFDALAAYIEVDRGRVLARAGRQWLTSQLGLNNFDGASVAIQPGYGLTIHGYGGWSLIQGLSEPPTSAAFAAADLLPPDRRGVMLGAQVRLRTRWGATLGTEYQREIRTDRAGLYSERAAFDGTLRVGSTMLDGAVEADLATGAFNTLSLRATRRLPLRFDAAVQARHYTPFFPLWTIWGAFAPVGYNEARGEARWRSSDGALSLSADGSYRRYQETNTGLEFLPLRDDGWHVGSTATWRPATAWIASGAYGRDIGFGASRSDGTAALHWTPNERGYVGVSGTAFQTIYEFRIGSGRVAGAIVDGGVRLRPDLRLVADAAIYQHIGQDTPSVVDWSQRRASLRLEWTVGRDPGMGVNGARAQ